jgi:hypothetical protein
LKKFILVVITAILLLVPACSSKPATTSAASVNLSQMASDIASLKTNFGVLNTSFTTISAQIAAGGSGIKQADFDSLKASFTALQKQVEAIQIPVITGLAKQTDLDAANAKLKTDEAAIVADAATITALNTQVVSLNAALTALTTRVTALEHPTTTTPVVVVGNNAHLISISGGIINGVIDVAGSYNVVITICGTQVGTPAVIGVNQWFMFGGISQIATLGSGAASFINGSTTVTAGGVSFFTANMVGAQLTVNGVSYTIDAVAPSGLALTLHLVFAGTTGAYPYVITGVSPSNQASIVAELVPPTGNTWTVGQAFSISISTLQFSVVTATVTTSPRA